MKPALPSPLSKFEQRDQLKPKHVCVLPSPTSLPMHVSCPACTHPMYHLPWQSTAPDQARPLLQRGVRQRWERAGLFQILLNPAAACWQCQGMSAHPWINERLPSLCLFLGLLSHTICMVLPSPLSMHGLSQNATRSLTDRWGLKQWGAI